MSDEVPAQVRPVVERDGLASVLSTFVDHIHSLRLTLNATMVMVSAGHVSATDEFREFAQEYGEEFEDSEEGISASFPLVHRRRAGRMVRNIKRAADGLTLVPRSFLVALVSEFDSLLGRLLRTLFLRKPSVLAGSERALTISDLSGFGSIDEARDFLLRKEIEAVIRKSHPDQFSWLEKTFSIRLRKGLPAWQVFVELTERRNLFVHCDGIVSAQYLRVCRENKVNLDPDLQVGDQLSVPTAYFAAAHACLYEIGVKLVHVLWRKLFPDERKAADNDLNENVYNLLVHGECSMAATILDFACVTLKKHSSELHRRMFIVNRAQAYKWLGDEDTCRSILEGEDWTACDRTFGLCASVLRENFQAACEEMKRLGPHGGITEAQFDDWPVFREFRQTTEFAEAFAEVFGHEFSDTGRRLKTERAARQRVLRARLDEVWLGSGDEGSEDGPLA